MVSTQSPTVLAITALKPLQRRPAASAAQALQNAAQ